jgi:hypothetical protein
MASSTLTIPNYAPATNVGQVQVTDQHNNIAPNAKALDISSDNSQRGNQTIINLLQDSHGVPPFAPRWPEPWRDEARFAQRSSDFRDSYPWSVLLGDFASPEENARLTAEM